jgi:hypothetical protein
MEDPRHPDDPSQPGHDSTYDHYDLLGIFDVAANGVFSTSRHSSFENIEETVFVPLEDRRKPSPHRAEGHPTLYPNEKSVRRPDPDGHTQNTSSNWQGDS